VREKNIGIDFAQPTKVIVNLSKKAVNDVSKEYYHEIPVLVPRTNGRRRQEGDSCRLA
jgi:hypothetical protein